MDMHRDNNYRTIKIGDVIRHDARRPPGTAIVTRLHTDGWLDTDTGCTIPDASCSVIERMGCPIEELQPLCYGGDGQLIEWGDYVEYNEYVAPGVPRWSGRVVAFDVDGNPVCMHGENTMVTIADAEEIRRIDHTIHQTNSNRMELCVEADGDVIQVIRKLAEYLGAEVVE